MPEVTVVKAARHDLSKPLADTNYRYSPIMQKVLARKPKFTSKQIMRFRKELEHSGQLIVPGSKPGKSLKGRASLSGAYKTAHDSVLQATASATQSGGFTTPLLSFDGLGFSTHTNRYVLEQTPPDIGVVPGMKYVVEMAGVQFSVYSKSTGNMVLGPALVQSLWTGSTGYCATVTNAFLHPVVAYDELAHRWIFESAIPYDSAFCVAISKTNNPLGSYYRYEYDNLPPKFVNSGYTSLGVWPNSYDVAINRVGGWPVTITSEDFIALDRSAMLQGESAPMVVINKPNAPGVYAARPVTLEGPTPPPAGEPGLFASYISPNLSGPGQPYALALWQLHVDWSNPANASLTGPNTVSVPAFNDMLCGNQPACIPEPAPGEALDAISDRLMSVDYRNYGNHEELVANQTVTASATGALPAGIRWYDLGTSSPGAEDWSLSQSGTYDPEDGNNRWVGSLAVDRSGDMALGYSVSGPNLMPSIAYTGRKNGAPAGKMSEPETMLMPGYGVQENSFNAWGGHSSMNVDPANGCAFWYGNEYYASTGMEHWSSHLADFKFSSCVPSPAGAVQGAVTSAASGQTISGAAVAVTADNIVSDTGADGSYQMKLLGGTYSITASHWGYTPKTISVTVSGGTVSIENFSLQEAPTATLSGHVTDGSGHGYGLYADVIITTPSEGLVANVWTDPETGAYSVSLPKGFDYMLTVKPYMDGYSLPKLTTVQLKNNQTQDFSLTVTTPCAAPGYAFTKGYGEDFNGA
ncbi:MAG: carboxypeptidase regulatory-like domain-containing protein, partial [Gammaproteobacteria bacterium]